MTTGVRDVNLCERGPQTEFNVRRMGPKYGPLTIIRPHFRKVDCASGPAAIYNRRAVEVAGLLNSGTTI